MTDTIRSLVYDADMVSLTAQQIRDLLDGAPRIFIPDYGDPQIVLRYAAKEDPEMRMEVSFSDGEPGTYRLVRDDS